MNKKQRFLIFLLVLSKNNKKTKRYEIAQKDQGQRDLSFRFTFSSTILQLKPNTVAEKCQSFFNGD